MSVTGSASGSSEPEKPIIDDALGASSANSLRKRVEAAAAEAIPSDVESTRSISPPLEEIPRAPIGLQDDVPDKLLSLYVDFLRVTDSSKDGSRSHIDKHFLTDAIRRESGEKPRVEIRAFGDSPLQIAIGTSDKDDRAAFLKYLADKAPPFLNDLDLVTAGSTTIEFCSKGVNKSTPMLFLSSRERFHRTLSEIGYMPGERIDARKHCTVVSCDADGTIWQKPIKGESPIFRDLDKSPARDSILTYLRGGGLLLINSGNDPQRVAQKIHSGIPSSEQHLLSNILISAAGGNCLFHITRPEGGEHSLEEISGYREEANVRGLSKEPIDVIYIGDDIKPTGNDWAGYTTAGFRNSFCVTSSEKVGVEKVIEAFSDGENPSIVRGLEFATKHIFDAINSITIPRDVGLFSSEPLLKRIHHTAVISRHTEILESVELMHFMISMLKENNPEAYKELQEISPGSTDLGIARKALSDTHLHKKLMDSYGSLETSLRKHGSIRHEMMARDKRKKLSKSSSLDLISIAESHRKVAQMKQALSGTNSKIDAEILATALQSPFDISASGVIEPTIREDVLREGADILLINGNNDLQQVDHVVRMIRRMPPANRPKQIIISGFGGHGTSHGPIWAHTEAEVLGKHLRTLLVGISEYEPKIYEEREATNSGENVRKSVAILKREGLEDKKILISGTPAAMLRQSLSFAAQCGDFSYERLRILPPNSKEFSSYFTNEDNSLVHVFCSLRELTSLMNYSTNTSYVKPYVFEKKALAEALLIAEDYYERLTKKSAFSSEKHLDQVVDSYNRLQAGKEEKGDKKLVNDAIGPMNDHFRDVFGVLETHYMDVREGALHNSYIAHRIGTDSTLSALLAEDDSGLSAKNDSGLSAKDDEVHVATDEDFE